MKFEVLTDNQVLQIFFKKPQPARREARWFKFLSLLEITRQTIVKGKVHVPGDVLSRIPQFMGPGGSALNNLTKQEALFNASDSIKEIYKVDKTSGSLSLARNGTFPKCVAQSEYIRLFLPSCKLKNVFLISEDKSLIPCSNVKGIIELARDSNISGQSFNTKTFFLLDRFYWKHKAKDFVSYYAGCEVCQCRKDSRCKPLGAPQTLTVLQRRRLSI